MPRVDGLVFVSSWARSAVEEWLPQVGVRHGWSPTSCGQCRSRVTSGRSRQRRQPGGDQEPSLLVPRPGGSQGRGFRFTLDVFGEGVERGDLLALAAELGIDDQVRLCGFRRDVPSLLPGYRVYVHASYSESSSLAIMEAMGAGLPVVSSDAGALPELFEDPEQGRFWPIDDPQRGAEILIELLGSSRSSSAPAALRARGSGATTTRRSSPHGWWPTCRPQGRQRPAHRTA